MRRQPSSSRTARTLGIATAVALAASGCAGVLAGAGPGSADPATSASTPVEDAASDPTLDDATGEPSPTPMADESAEPTPDDTSPPTDDAPKDDATAPPQAEDGRKAVDVIPVVTSDAANVVDAGGYVQGVIEAGGTCSYVLTQAGKTVSGTSPAEPDATTTWCANVTLTLPEPGTAWTLEVRYDSPASTGTGTLTSAGKVS